MKKLGLKSKITWKLVYQAIQQKGQPIPVHLKEELSKKLNGLQTEGPVEKLEKFQKTQNYRQPYLP